MVDTGRYLQPASNAVFCMVPLPPTAFVRAGTSQPYSGHEIRTLLFRRRSTGTERPTWAETAPGTVNTALAYSKAASGAHCSTDSTDITQSPPAMSALSMQHTHAWESLSADVLHSAGCAAVLVLVEHSDWLPEGRPHAHRKPL